jgi:hypothetical protein
LSINDGAFVDVVNNHTYKEYGVKCVAENMNGNGVVWRYYFGLDSEWRREDPHNYAKLKIVVRVVFSGFWGYYQNYTIMPNCDYRGKLCGLLGDWDGVSSNDWKDRKGNVIPISGNYAAQMNYGIKWLVDDFCWQDLQAINPNVCTQAQWNTYVSDQYCGRMRLPPFDKCVKDIRAAVFDCAFDICMARGKDIDNWICESMGEREVDCEDWGFNIADDYRSERFCPPECPENMVWRDEAHQCPETTRNCKDYDPNAECDKPVKRGCVCSASHPVKNDRGECVEQCPGDVPDVAPPPTTNPGNASTYGEPHHRTFDGVVAPFQGNCEYTVTRTKNAGDLPTFNVIEKTHSINNPKVTMMRGVRVTYKWKREVTILRMYDGHAGTEFKSGVWY